MTAETGLVAFDFVEKLSKLRFTDVFNPYADICSKYDKPDAAVIRKRNLHLVIDAALSKGIDSMWFARDLGYRGGRRTGLALTDEVHLVWHAQLLSTPPLIRATKGTAMSERTATTVWDALQLINRPIFLWNVFPLHPHEPNDQMTNRCHKKVERKAFQKLNSWLIETLKPKQVIAIGRDAQCSIDELGIKPVKIRHPSYGGKAEFLEGLSNTYGISLDSEPYQGSLF